MILFVTLISCKENKTANTATNKEQKVIPYDDTNGRENILEDVSSWEAFKESYLQTLLILMAISVSLFLLQFTFRMVIKNFKKLRKVDYSIVYDKGKIGFSQKISQLKLADLGKKETIIISIIIGTFIALILGYLFGETKYLIRFGTGAHFVSEDVFFNRFYKDHRSSGGYLDKRFNFNYLVAIASFIITSSLAYEKLALYK